MKPHDLGVYLRHVTTHAWLILDGLSKRLSKYRNVNEQTQCRLTIKTHSYPLHIQYYDSNALLSCTEEHVGRFNAYTLLLYYYMLLQSNTYNYMLYSGLDTITCTSSKLSLSQYQRGFVFTTLQLKQLIHAQPVTNWKRTCDHYVGIESVETFSCSQTGLFTHRSLLQGLKNTPKVFETTRDNTWGFEWY